MGNSGRSSTGCGLCRKRKIKCDEARPGCRRCAQIRKPCPGYPFSIALEILPAPVIEPIPVPVAVPEAEFELDSDFDWNQFSAPEVPAVRIPNTPPPAYTPRVKRSNRQQPRALPRILKTDTQKEVHCDAGKNHTRSITPPPKYDVQHQAICFFLSLFSFKATRLYSIPILDFLPDMLAKSAERSPISQASRAVSRMLLADRYSGYDTRLQTSDEYAKALEAIRSTMSDLDEAVKDESVTAVWLLGLYEAINSTLSHGRDARQPKDLDAEWHSHIQHMRGAMRLLRLRGMQQFTNARSEQIFRVFKAAIRMRLFMLNHVTSADFDYLEVDIYKEEHEFVPSETANKATNFFTNTALHLERAKYALQRFELQPGSRDLAKEIDELLYEGECYDASMLRWSKTDPGWDIMPVTDDLSYTMWALYPFHAQYYFYNFWIFLYWIRFLIARVKLYETLIELVKAKKRNGAVQHVHTQRLAHLDNKIDNFIRIIQKTADELIGLTAYALGDISNMGTIISAPSSSDPNGGWKEVNVIAAMQLVIPMKVLQRSAYPSLAQKGAMDIAITHIADGFRRQPLVPEYMR